MAKQKIFFSYSRVDGSAFALRLATDLKEKGFDVWIDQEDIRAGLEWDTEVGKALESCDCLLFLATEKSVISNNVLDEVYYVLEQHKKVIPLIFVNSKIPFRLNRLQHIDFTMDYDAAIAQLVNELEGITPDNIYTPEEKASPAPPDKPFFAKKYRAVLIAAGLAVVVAAGLLIAGKNKSGTSANTRSGAAPADTTGSNPDNMAAIAYGDWSLTDVEPTAELHKGYLHIDTSGTGSATIKAYMQFYYPGTKADASLKVFNAFVDCASCALSREMRLKVEDIAVGSHTIKRALVDQGNGKKAGDTISDASSNKSLHGTADLRFVDNSHAVVKVRQTQTIELTKELTLEPFEYTFHFEKKD